MSKKEVIMPMLYCKLSDKDTVQIVGSDDKDGLVKWRIVTKTDDGKKKVGKVYESKLTFDANNRPFFVAMLMNLYIDRFQRYFY